MINVPNLVFAVFVSVGAAYAGNRALQAVWGDRSLFWAVPWWEEACKTGMAVYFGVPVIAVHAAFGFTELLYDGMRPSRDGFLVGSLTLLGHLVFGAATWAAVDWTGSLWMGYGVAVVLHMGWNRAVVRLMASRRAPGARGGQM